MVMEVSEADLTNESLSERKQEGEGPLTEGAEPVAEAVGNGEEHEEVKMETGGATEEGVEGEEEAAEHGDDADAGDGDAAPAE